MNPQPCSVTVLTVESDGNFKDRLYTLPLVFS